MSKRRKAREDFKHRPDLRLTAYCPRCRRSVAALALLSRKVTPKAVEQYRAFILKVHDAIHHAKAKAAGDK